MITMGDEMRRTQHGNNNAYCQDNEISWLDWTLFEKHADVHRFFKLLVARRLMRDVEHERRRVSLNQFLREATKAWHGVKLKQPDWSYHSHSLALGGELRRERLRLYLVLNAYWEALEFELPRVSKAPWRRWIDTALDSPMDISEWQLAAPVQDGSYRVEPRSAVVLISSLENER
jgi:glycogen operon protein